MQSPAPGARQAWTRTPPNARETLTAAQLVAAAAAAGFAALAAYRVYQRRPLRAAIGLTVAALLVLYVAHVIAGVPDLQGEVETSGDALGGWAYLVVAGMAFFETGAPPFTVSSPASGGWRSAGCSPGAT